MKRILFVLLLVTSASAMAQTNHSSRQMAAQGDTVWVIINHIKPDKRQQFEQFVHEVFWPMSKKLSAEDQKLFRQTRVLHPIKAEADGTYSYIFIMDPLISGADYEIDHLLKKMYDSQKAAEYSKMLEDTYAREQTQVLTVQSQY